MIATLFDFDGVLVDSEPVHLAAFNDVLEPHGLTIDAATYSQKYLSLDDAGVFRRVFFAAGQAIEEHEVNQLVEAKSPRFLARFDEGFRAFPGAAEIIARRAARGPVGIVSGALEPEIAFSLEKMGVKDAISFIVSAERTAASKPDAAPYLLALEELRVIERRFTTSPLRAVAIEDSLGGVISAKGAGLRCVAVAHSYTAAELIKAGADAAVGDLASLTDALLEAGT